MTREDFEGPGHFCGASQCRFARHTHVGPYCVSTVGDYWPRGAKQREDIGYKRSHETMVFRLDDKGETDGHPIDFAPYKSDEAAAIGHERMVRKWLGVARRRKP